MALSTRKASLPHQDASPVPVSMSAVSGIKLRAFEENPLEATLKKLGEPERRAILDRFKLNRVLKPHTWAGDVRAQQYEHAAMACFDFEGRVDITIKTSKEVNSARIRRLHAEIQPEIHGSTIRFSLRSPQKLSVEINGDITHNLQLFANPPEKDAPVAEDEGVRYFGPGVHFPADDGIEGAIKLHSNQTLYIAGGAIVHGTIQTPFHEGVHDATIRGRGILLGERDTKNKHGLAKIGFKCRNITVRDVHFIDSYGWILEMLWCTNVRIENVKMIAYRGKSDGIDLASCQNVTVKDCYIRSANDSLVVVNVRYDTSWWGDPHNTIRDVRFENIRMEDAHGGNIFHVRQINDPATIENITYKDIRLLGGSFSPSSLIKSHAESTIGDIAIKDFRVFGQKVTTRQAAKLRFQNVDPGVVTVK